MQRGALGEHGHHAARDHAREQRRDRRHPHQRQRDDQQRRQQQPGRDGEIRLKRAGDRADLLERGAIGIDHQETHRQIDHEGDQHRRDRGRHHVLDVRENIGDRRRQIGGVGQGRHLVAEERARDHGARRPVDRHVEAGADAHQRQTHRADRAPRRSQRQRHHRAQHHRRRQEDLWRQQRQAVIDQRRHRAAGNPHPDDHADTDQHRHRWQRHMDDVEHPLLDVLPGEPQGYADNGGDREADGQRYMGREIAEIEQLQSQDAQGQNNRRQRQCQAGTFSGPWS